MKHFIQIGLFCFISMALASELHGQNKYVININGIVLDAESLQAVPYSAVQVKNQLRGTVCDNSGYFSVLVKEYDTLVFSSIGYASSQFVIPNLTDTDYSLIQLMKKETIILQEVEVVAWPNVKEFVRAFHELKLPKGEEDRWFDAQMDLAKVMKQQHESDKFYYDQIRYSKLYNTTSFMPPNNFLNPINWTNFIKDWRDGVFKKKK